MTIILEKNILIKKTFYNAEESSAAKVDNLNI